MHFAAFVITYRRPAVLARTLTRLREQSLAPERILVMDNDPMRSAASVVERPGSAVEYRPLDANRGPAGAAAVALAELAAEGAPWSWIYWGDDDDPPEDPDCLARLVRLGEHEQDEAESGGKVPVGAVALSGVLWDWRRGRPRRVPDEALSGAVEVDAVGGGGQLLLSRRAVAAVGLPDERLFWGFEDHEYCLRLRRAGYRILVDGEALLERRRAAGRLGFVPRRSPVPRGVPDDLPRLYYATRNPVFALRTTFGRPDLARRQALRAVVRSLAAFRRGPRYGLATARALLTGVWHGYRGRLGRHEGLTLDRSGEDVP